MDAAQAGTGGIAILGGSFNPLHIGHLRLAIEVREALGDRISRVDILPCARPPHKRASGLLPFGYRCELIEKAIEPYPWLKCNPLEGEREHFSYTWDTLGIYAEREPGRELFFILGSQDYMLISTWYHGMDLPKRCTLLILPRGDFTMADFALATGRHWPGARRQSAVDSNITTMLLPNGAKVLFLPAIWLDISATLVRLRMLAGKNVDYLLPPSVLKSLRDNWSDVEPCWR